VDQAIPCSLIVNELMTNALKYAFDGEAPGTLALALRRAGEARELEVRDDGRGFPEGFDITKTDTPWACSWWSTWWHPDSRRAGHGAVRRRPHHHPLHALASPKAAARRARRRPLSRPRPRLAAGGANARPP
jgi:hypothetical protein